MKTYRPALFVIALAAVLAAPTAVWAEPNGHPRLLLDDQKVAAIREAIARPGSHHREAYQAMKARVAQGTAGYDDHIEAYKYGYLMREAAMLSLLATDAAEKKRYADIAYKGFLEMYETDRMAHNGYGLSRAMQGKALAYAYDWLHGTWTMDQKKAVRARIDEALEAWKKFGHVNLGDQRASNWVAVCRGGEILLMLAVGGDEEDKQRYDKLVKELKRHIEAGYGSLGVSQEGLGYTEYPGAFLLPAVYGTKLVGDNTLFDAAQKKQWWKLAMYGHSFQTHERKFVMTGVAGTSNYDEGWTSLLFGLVPEDEMPYYKYFYERHMGRSAPGGPQDRFDPDRAGTVYALIYYPTEPLEAKNPTNVYPVGAEDDRGYYFFRNRWKGPNDVLISVMADTVSHGRAWDAPEALAINLMGFNTRFIGGPSKDGGKKQDPGDKLFSALLVDGKYKPEKGQPDTGKKGWFNNYKGVGLVMVEGGPHYQALGVDEVERQALIDFRQDEKGTAVFSTYDRIRDGDQHTYTWQANIGDEKGDDSVKVETGTEDGRPTFTLTGRNGRVKGWVLSPAGATVKGGDPLQIETKGDDVDLWVVMVGQEQSRDAPTVKISGEGMDSRILVNDKLIRFDRKSWTMKAEQE